MIKKILLLFVSVLLGLGTFAQVQTRFQQRIDLTWESRPFTMENIEHLHFKDAVYFDEYGKIPCYTQLFSTSVPGKKAEITLENPVYFPIEMENLLTEADKKMISDTLFYNSKMMPEKYASNVVFTLLPFRINPQTGLLERLYCVDITVSFVDNPHYKRASDYNFPTTSPLATGDWYKVQVSATGVYKITGADLKKMGMDIASIKSKNLKMYGLGGGMIPEICTETPNTGIQEQAIFVSKNDDGAFGNNDYILFYGEGPHVWKYNSGSQTYEHSYNIYSDYNFYFISATSDAQGKRIQIIDNNNLTENTTSSQSDYYMFHEQDLINPVEAGKVWFGEKFGVQSDYTFSVNVPNAITSEKFFFRSNVASIGDNAQYMFYANGSEFLAGNKPNNKAICYQKYREYFTAPSGSFSLKISLRKGTSNVEGWLDFFEIQARRNLMYLNAQTDFRDKKTIGDDKITKFTLQNASPQIAIWDVSDHSNIAKMQPVSEDGNLSFKIETNILREFIAFESANCYTPILIGKIANQNLLSMRNIQSAIVTHPDFAEYANQLAEEHRNTLHLKTTVVTTEQLYNEFSSGKQDIGSIRDFMRMFYLTSETTPPQYLTLFGDASLDYKNKQAIANFVPTWESASILQPAYILSLKDAGEYASDDFFALLDATEGGTPKACTGLVDIGVGRFPVKTAQEAADVMKKRLHYTSNNPETMGEWRNLVTFVADDPGNNDGVAYVTACEEHEQVILSIDPNILVNKIYSDAYPRVAGPGGIRYPDVNKAINTQADQGTLILNYVGHGSARSWAHERIFDIGDLQSWKNYNRLPFVITETCTYAPFDKSEVAAGELMFLHPIGGAIAMFTTTKETYNSYNNPLINWLYRFLFPTESNNYQGNTLGYSSMHAKRNYLDNNNQMFVLFGDPAMTLAFPKDMVVCTGINENNVETTIDTLRALSVVSVSGEVRNHDGSLKSDFNGTIYPTVFDKESNLRTSGELKEGTTVFFKLWKNIIYKGNAQVENGKFTYEFFVPKDIDYDYGFSQMSFYALDGNAKRDANGVFTKFVVGGINPEYKVDTIAPEIRLFMNDTLFISGGCTDQNPVLLVRLFDESGINTTGSGIGHNTIAILDNNTKNELVLNNFYEVVGGRYSDGMVKCPFYDLAEGKHTITVRAWDSYNNSATKSIDFVVVSSSRFMIENLYAYPNPFNVGTNFVFDHNGSDETLDVSIRIFDISGRWVKEIKQSIYATGYRQPIYWDGNNDNGAPVGNGYYIYQTIVKTASGSTAKKSGKVVVVR